MKRIFLLLIALVVFGCSVRQTESYLNSGDYDSAIDNAVYALRNNKDKKGKQDYVYMLEEAYAKAKTRDEADIILLAKDANPRNLEQLFNTYMQLHNRQEKVRPLLPLKKLSEGKEAVFAFADYSDQIVSSKNALSKYLYDNAKALLATNDKPSCRRAYDDLVYLNQLSPNFKDVNQLMQTALAKGSDYVRISSSNEIRILIPIQLERELLDFQTYSLNDKWTVYHNNPQKGVNYDYAINLNFRQIDISPEHVTQRKLSFEKEIKVGQKKKTIRGLVVKDSLGNPVMIDVFKKIYCNVAEFDQNKAVHIAAKVDYVDLRSNQLLRTFPLSSEFIFQNRYARYKGDKRAVDRDYLPYFAQMPMIFPTNEQMVLDTGEDLKAKLRDILLRNRLGS